MTQVEGEIRDEELDPEREAEREARRQLALAQIRQYLDSVLRMKAPPVEEFDDDLKRLATRLGERGIQTGLHYSPSLPDHPALRPHVAPAEEFPAARAWAAEELSLPMFAELSPAEVDRVADEVGALAGAPVAG